MDADAEGMSVPGGEVQQLKERIVELEAERQRLNTGVVVFTGDEVNEMRDIANQTLDCAKALVQFSVDISGPCSPWNEKDVADAIEHDGDYIAELSSKLLDFFSRS